MARRRFRATRHGLVVSLTEPEIELFRRLPEELRGLLEAEDKTDDPVVQRLFPHAYLDPTEERAEDHWQEQVHPELLRERVAALTLVTATLDGATSTKNGVEVVLGDDDVAAWLGVLNDLRLTLGTQLGITEDTDFDDLDPDDAATPAVGIYSWLTWFQGELVETLVG